ncbi:MAG: TetR/AcrR family transcriptional regulator [Myxococcota bacterium]|nr:TetR/AcrR family transcriptional regulator [Myxococcota bacterium]
MSAPGAAKAGRGARARFPGVRAPRPLLSAETERALTGRQREVLENLETLLADEKLAELTMAQIAAAMNCSLRTLYGIAPSKDELILTLVDRRLHRIGRAATRALDERLPPLQAVRAYLAAANEAVQPEALTFSKAFADVPGASRLLDAHEDYVVAVTRALLDRAVEAAAIPPVDTFAVAHVLGGLGREFSRPEVAEQAAEPPKATADALVEILLRGLESG